MDNKKFELTDEEIRDEFSDVIEAVKLDEIYKIERYIINIIKEILNFGVNRNDHEFILDIISKVDSIKNDEKTGYEDILKGRNSNKKIIKTIIDEKEDLHYDEPLYSNIEDLIEETEKSSSRR